VTAITIQSGTGVRGYTALPVARVVDQLDELLARLPVAAVKIGQVPSVAEEFGDFMPQRLDSGLNLLFNYCRGHAWQHNRHGHIKTLEESP
jgi:hypothetical protein